MITQPPLQRELRLFPGVKWLGCGVDHPPNLAARLKKGYSYTYPLPPTPGQHGMVKEEFYILVREMTRKSRHGLYSAYLLKANNVLKGYRIDCNKGLRVGLASN